MVVRVRTDQVDLRERDVKSSSLLMSVKELERERERYNE